MKALRVSLTVAAFLLIGFPAQSNPIIVRFFNELQVTNNSWVLEMYASAPMSLNGWYIRSNSGTAVFKNNIQLGNGYLLITQDSLVSPLSIDPLGDSLVINSQSGPGWGQLAFGNCASALIPCPRSGQSICMGAWNYYYLDNSPTLGQNNDSTNAMGTIHGFITDSLGQPISGVMVSSLDGLGPVYSDASGYFDARDYARRVQVRLTHSNCTTKNVTVQIWPESTVYVNIVMERVTSVGEEPFSQWSYELNQNYPNPFNPITTISFTIPRLSFVMLKVYDIFGREVSTLVNETRSAGTNEVQWDASDVASGVYFYRLFAGSTIQTRSMILIR